MMNNEMEDCIKNCWDCRHRCQKDLYTFCLQQGGDHVSASHVKVMTDCIQICQLSADFMTRQSPYHEATCRACAEICEACAKSCRSVVMDECARACEKCAESCRAMSAEGERKAA